MTFNFKVIFNNELDGNVIKILNFKKKILKKKFNTRQISVYINIYIYFKVIKIGEKIIFDEFIRTWSTT